MKIIKRTIASKSIVDEIVATDKDWIIVILKDGTEISIHEEKLYPIRGNKREGRYAMTLNMGSGAILVLPRATNLVWITEDR